MKLVTAFFRLVRWPNLVFIIVTQLLFYYCVTMPVFKATNSQPYMPPQVLFLLIAASVCIAAAGYIINDYFDLSIDRINKPEKLVVEKIIKRRWTIVWHLVLSLLGLLLSFYACMLLSFFTPSLLIGIANLCCVLALWVYSTTYKRRLLIGNILISALTAWTIFVLYFAEFPHWFKASVEVKQNYNAGLLKLLKYTILYAGFAFIISLVREAVKDMEDIEGDVKYNCKTIPIVWGIPAAKVFVGVWLVVLVGALCVVQFYAMHLGWWWSVVYAVLLVIIPLLNILRKLHQAQTAKHYHQLSAAIKFVMLAGILSMVFFKIYL
jgi:4-hydroxybenzoate polyprenyltransferase